MQSNTPYLVELNHIHHEIVKTNNLTHVELLLAKSDQIYNKIEGDADKLYSAFEIISILAIANLSFFV